MKPKSLTKKEMLFIAATKNSASSLLAAGYSASSLRAAGYSASSLRAAGYSASSLLAAGYSASSLRAAGYSASDVLAAGYSASDVLAAGYSASDLDEWESIPTLENPYSKLWNDIKNKNRIHLQSTFGPVEEFDPSLNVCGTPMCTAGHLVNMAGAIGYALKKKYGWGMAAELIHHKAHPGLPVQDFGSIPQAQAMVYIETMADFEQGKLKKLPMIILKD